MVMSFSYAHSVMPAKAGIQKRIVDASFRWHDKMEFLDDKYDGFIR